MKARMPGTVARAAAAVGLAALAWCGSSAGESGPCQLMISSRPQDATVFVDGKERGLAPLMVKGLSTGKHVLRVVLKGYKPWTKTVRLRPGPRIVSASLEKTGESEPQPATTDAPPAREEPKDAGAGETKKDEGPPRKIDVECPCCKGSGLIKVMGCARCSATGYYRAESCSRCAGKGRIDYECRGCEGSGKITRGTKEGDCPLCRGKGAPPCPMCRGKGKVSRPNPAAASYETTPCISCDGDGYEKNLKCRKCGGQGKVRDSGPAGAGIVRILTFSCPFCGGDGEAPAICRRCDGRGSFGPKGPQRIITPCMSCGGTGYQFLPCRTCRGKRWHRSR